MIDFEGAFDAVWRDGGILKLHEAGITDNMLLYLSSFLENRKSRSLVNGFTSDWIDTLTGVPQGSVVAPIIFVLFISHITRQMCSHIGYADDLTIWISAVDAKEASKELQKSLDRMLTLSKKWRLSINTQKTKVVNFQRRGQRTVNLTYDGTPLKQVS